MINQGDEATGSARIVVVDQDDGVESIFLTRSQAVEVATALCAAAFDIGQESD